MLRGMSARRFLEWRAYYELEPFDETRADARSAQIVQTVFNVVGALAGKSPKVQLSDCLLPFGDDPKPEPKAKTWKDIKATGLLWAETINHRDKTTDAEMPPPGRRGRRPKDPLMSAVIPTAPRRTRSHQ